MQAPLQITFHDVDHSPAAEEKIRKKFEKLTKFFEKIISAHVVVTKTQNAKHQGKLYALRIQIVVPGKELAVSGHENESLEVAIRDAFNAIQRQVEGHTEKLHGDVKQHQELLRGRIVRLPEGKDFGFLEGVGGTEYYFNAVNVVHPTFKKLAVGMEVHFVEAYGNEGPQAHRVSAC